MNQLTWYPGTILPYASLWHTLLRATWLNDLHAGEIRGLADGARRRHVNSNITYLGEVDVRAVATALGEPQRALSRFSILEQFPDSVRAVCMVPRIRWCPACIDSGYHTLLGSIELIERCPIHEVPLLDKCPKCEDGFKAQVRGLAVRHWKCRCGSTDLLRPRSARQPSLRAQDVRVWSDVAQWVRQLGNFTRSAFPHGCLQRRIQLALVMRWCRDLGVRCPDCFADESSLWPDEEESKRWSSYKALSGDFTGFGQLNHSDASQSWLVSPEISVYRSMGRHLRRHGVARPDRWIKRLMDTLDPAIFAATMAVQPRARMAFTEMLWARRIEPSAVVHRWPNRPAPACNDFDLPWTHWSPIHLRHDIGLAASTGPRISLSTGQWIACHAVAMAMQHAWSLAWRQAEKSIADCWADWSVDDSEPSGKWASVAVMWFCRPEGNSMRFVGYLRDIVAQFPIASATKLQRREANVVSVKERGRHVNLLSGLQCLGWTSSGGWFITRASTPTDETDVRRVRLLHTGRRTHCWVFTSENHFVARLDGGAIEVSGATARDALSALRNAVVQYQRIYGELDAVRVVDPIPSQLPPEYLEASRYLIRIAHLMREDNRFWHINASLFRPATDQQSGVGTAPKTP